MSTAPIDSGGSGGGVHRILSHLSMNYNRNNTVGTVETGTTPTGDSSPNIPLPANEYNENGWINYLNRFDRVLSGSLLHFLYRSIDVVLLFIGLFSSKSACQASNRLAITSICLLIFYFIDLLIVLSLLVRNLLRRHADISEEQKAEEFRRASHLRGFFLFFKLVPVCAGTAYAFSATPASSNECELLRFCLGMVCFSTWLLILIPPTRPELPVRRSLLTEAFVLLFVLVINCTYMGTVAQVMKDINAPTCQYNSTEDLYFGSPLKSYAYFGLILFACTTIIHMINLLINQLCFRLNERGRRFYRSYYPLQYALNYFGALIVIYYYSVGALILFQARSGEPCRKDAPDLYRTLLIWEWIRILSPLIAIPLMIIFCCLGVFFGVMLSYCLPASITVPIVQSLRVSKETAGSY